MAPPFSPHLTSGIGGSVAATPGMYGNKENAVPPASGAKEHVTFAPTPAGDIKTGAESVQQVRRASAPRASHAPARGTRTMRGEERNLARISPRPFAAPVIRRIDADPNPLNPISQRLERMRERVANLKTPMRAKAGGSGDDANTATLPRGVTFAPGVGGTPLVGTGYAMTPGNPVAARITHKTPAPMPQGGNGGNKRRASVESLLSEYLRSSGVTPPHSRSERAARVDSLRENANSAQHWCEFLEAEEMALGEETKGVGAPAGRNGVSLFRLYEHATKTLPQVSRNAPFETQGYYLRLYLGLARQQMVSNMDDARDTFKYLKSEGFWQRHGMYWTEWAAFGHQYKGEEKALKILAKGLNANPEPRCIVEEMKEAIEQGRYGVPVAPPAHTSHEPAKPPLTVQNDRERDASEARERFQREIAARQQQQRAAAPGLGAAAIVDDATVAVPAVLNGETRQHAAGGRLAGTQPAAEEEEATVAVAYTPNTAAAVARVKAAAASAQPLQPLQPTTEPASSSVAVAANPPAAAAADAAAAAAKVAEEKKKSRPRVRENSEMVVVRGVKYLKLECVGQGGTCKVYKVLCPKRKTYALKRIRLQGREKETIAGFMDEIRLLQSLRGKENIIQLVDAEVCKTEGLIYVVLEYGEIDLARLLSKREKQARAKGKGGANGQSNAGMIDDNFLRLYFEQMVEAVGTIHELKIVHSDLKPANFLFVEGALKLIDFGIAKQDTSKTDTTNIVRDHQVGTVNYMSPEAILNGQPSALGGPLKVGRASDIWSLGCILYQMVYGQTPFARITGMIPKLHAITDPKHEIPMPPVANPHLTALITACLERHPHRRITIAEILKHPFLRPAAAATPASKGSAAAEEPASPAQSGLSAQQLQGLLEQIQKHGANVDVGAVTQEVFRQIATGESNVSISPLLRKHAKGGGEKKGETEGGGNVGAESVAAGVGAMDLNAGGAQ